MPGRGDAATTDTVTAQHSRRRRGRPAGNSDTRDAILASARELFARNGISKTSIRAIATDAGVDSALVHHYFGTKERLFAAAVDAPVDPAEVLRPLQRVPVDELGHAIPTMVLTLWESEAALGLKAALRSALAGDQITMFAFFLRDVVVNQIAPRVDDPPGTGIIRTEFAVSQILGVVMARHILGLEPFASLPVNQVIDTIAPTVQRYLTGDLPELT